MSADPGPAPALRGGRFLPAPLRRGLARVAAVADGVTGWRLLLYVAHLVLIGALAISNILLGLTVLAAPWRRRIPRETWVKVAPLLIPAGLYVLFLLVSTAVSYEPLTSLGDLGELFSLMTLVLALLVVRGERAVRLAVDGYVATSALLAVHGLAQYFMGYGDLHRRIRGPFSHYMTFSGVLLIADLLLLAYLVCGNGWRSRWRWAALVLINTALVGSLTRSAWLGLVIALTVLLAVRKPRLLLLYLPLGPLLIAIVPEYVLLRVVSIGDVEDPSTYDRLCMAEAGLYMVAERPLFGIGPDLVRVRYPIYRHPTAPRYEVPHLHDNLLQIAAERGLVSVAAFLWLMLAAISLAWRRFREEGGHRGPRADLYLGVFVALLAFNVAGLFEYNWGDTEVQRVAFFLLAMPFCLLFDDPARAPVAMETEVDA
jgi:putative inorganic carbon (HCO3(-)) transporter